ncbi:MAG: hypothetical protein ACOYN5_09645 [Bacteroidales bacterium]
MKFYDVESEFTFGKYEGKTLQEVFDKDPKYIDFCFNNYDEFYVSPDVMKELKSLNPKAVSQVVEDGEDLSDDELDTYFEAEEVEEFEPETFDDEDINWEDDDLTSLDDDDFDNFDDFDDDDY